jgi:hypothetical protein
VVVLPVEYRTRTYIEELRLDAEQPTFHPYPERSAGHSRPSADRAILGSCPKQRRCVGPADLVLCKSSVSESKQRWRSASGAVERMRVGGHGEVARGGRRAAVPSVVSSSVRG